jgi:hypothetical protein
MTDEQREQMEAIKKELEPEFEKIVDELVEMEDAVQELKYDLFEKVGIKYDTYGRMVDENGKSLRDDREMLEKKNKELEREMSKDVEMQARMKRINERASGFMRGFQVKMLDVLTDEQLVKMQHIIDNPPEYVKKRRDQLQKEREEREKARKEKEEWQPGIDSWRPGDPLPVEYLQERKQRRGFPRAQPAENP